MNKRSLGGSYEEQAAAFLESSGLHILCKNYRVKTGEIDLIAKEKDTYVFVEVKSRQKKGSGYAAEAVDRKKQKRISRTAEYFLVKEVGTLDIPCRFDVIGFDEGNISWIRNAFDYCR